MGHQATIIVNMDLVDQIKDDPKYGEKVYYATLRANSNDIINIDNTSKVVDVAHADVYQPMIVGNLTAIVCDNTTSWQQGDTVNDIKLRSLQQFAEEMGYRLVKKSKK